MYAMSVTRAESSGERAMAPHAMADGCVEPSSDLGGKNEKTDNHEGWLPVQKPSRAMTSQATSAACVKPWQQQRGEALQQKCMYPPGSYASEVARGAPTTVASPTTRGSSQLGVASNSFLQQSSGGSAGKPGCSCARRHTLTVAFELLRLLEHLVQ